MDIEERLDRATLRRPELEVDEAWDRVRRLHRRRRGRAAGLVAVALVGLVAGAIGLVVVDRDEPATNVATGVTESDESPLSVPEGWTTMAPSPLSPRILPASVATDSEFVIWGGRTTDVLSDGAAYNFESDRWRTMSDSPLAAQADAVAVWTGQRVVIWGGVGENGSTVLGTPAVAAWDPETDQWQPVQNDLGLGASKSLTGAAWTGSELVLLGVTGPPNAVLPSDAYAIDPSTGEARSLDPIPRPDAAAYRPRGRAAFFAGDEILLVTVADRFPVTIDRLDVQTGTWAATALTPMPGLDVSEAAAAWTGADLVVANHQSEHGGVVFDPSTGSLRDIPSSNSRHRFPAAAVTPSIVSVGDRYLDLDTNEWNDAGPIPEPLREFPVTVASGGAMYVWGGTTCVGGMSCSDIGDPGAGLIWGPP